MSWECACGISNSDSKINCDGCGWNIEQSMKYLKEQGLPTTKKSSSGNALPFGIIGVLIGCIIGFIGRPSYPLIGQLPFDLVITRGTTLQGFNSIMRGAAEDSFNYLIIGGFLGGILGFFLAQMTDTAKVPVQGFQVGTEPSKPAMPVLITTTCPNCRKVYNEMQKGEYCEECGCFLS